MFNIHTHIIDSVPCLYSTGTNDIVTSSIPEHVALSIGIHPWDVTDSWEDTFENRVVPVASTGKVWAIGECGLDKLHGPSLDVQMNVMKTHIALAEEVGKPIIVHCVKAFDQLLALRKETEQACKRDGHEAQPWIVHGFRGKPEQAKQIMAKGLYLSLGHQYNTETLRFLFNHACPFFLETDDLHLSVCHIYEQAARCLGVDVSRLEDLCDPFQTIFHH